MSAVWVERFRRVLGDNGPQPITVGYDLPLPSSTELLTALLETREAAKQGRFWGVYNAVDHHGLWQHCIQVYGDFEAWNMVARVYLAARRKRRPDADTGFEIMDTVCKNRRLTHARKPAILNFIDTLIAAVRHEGESVH